MLLTTVLFGCTDQQDPAGSNNSAPVTSTPKNGANNSMSMTIAETLPSCVAFEYGESGQPYCFYAYDAEGRFYRVIWDMWEGLHEKDLITVAYTGGIRELHYDEYPDGGYTPKYEITATFVQPERDVLASCLTNEGDSYTLTLPQSGETLELTAEQASFVPYITNELVAEAEDKILRDVAGSDNHSSFYLQINEDYLCLACEVIHYTDAADGSDHEHLFYAERISDRAVKAELVPHDPFAKNAVLYASDGAEITAYRSLLWSQQENADGSFTETTVERYDVAEVLNGNTPVSIEKEIPTLLLDGPVTARLPVNCEIESVTLLTADVDGFVKSGTTLDELSDLAPGTYYVAAYVSYSGNCAPDALQLSARYEDLFRLEVRVRDQ